MSVVVVNVTLNGVNVPLELGDETLAAIAAAIRDDATPATWPVWMNVGTAATYLDVSSERIRKLISARTIPYSQEAPGCRVFLNRHDLDIWMRAQRHQPRR
jgi:excisionase family DNA binding protein